MVLFFAGKDSKDVLMNGAWGMQRDWLSEQKEEYAASARDSQLLKAIVGTDYMALKLSALGKWQSFQEV